MTKKREATLAKVLAIEQRDQTEPRFRLAKMSKVIPRCDRATVRVPDATPSIISAYDQGDQQAVLAKVRYNRLIDTFLGITAFSLQSCIRATVEGMGEVSIDEVYVGTNHNGQQFVIPVQAENGDGQAADAQTKQRLAYCREKFPNLRCRSIAVQFLADDVIAMFELVIHEGQMRVLEEAHYRLVPPDYMRAENLEARSPTRIS